jgi:hypothetical protein
MDLRGGGVAVGQCNPSGRAATPRPLSWDAGDARAKLNILPLSDNWVLVGGGRPQIMVGEAPVYLHLGA